MSYAVGAEGVNKPVSILAHRTIRGEERLVGPAGDEPEILTVEPVNTGGVPKHRFEFHAPVELAEPGDPEVRFEPISKLPLEIQEDVYDRLQLSLDGFPLLP